MTVERFGHYELIRLIGRGGMGEVFEAHDTEQDRTVALKRLMPTVASDEEFKRRFSRESRLAARLNSPHVIPIHRSGEIDGHLYIDMRLIEGQDLEALLAEGGALEPARAVAIVQQVASALDAAHHAGLIHRDVKPSNVLIDSAVGAHDFAYLADFGITRAVADQSQSLTSTHAVVGSLDYMAPEQFDGVARFEIDVYSLGCLLFQCLTRTRPFPVEGFPALMRAHINEEPPRPSQARPELGDTFDAVIARAMAKDPSERYPGAGALAAAAERALSGVEGRGGTDVAGGATAVLRPPTGGPSSPVVAPGASPANGGPPPGGPPLPVAPPVGSPRGTGAPPPMASPPMGPPPVGPAHGAGGAPPVGPHPVQLGVPDDTTSRNDDGDARRPRRRLLVVGAVVVLLAVVLGAGLSLLSGGEDEGAGPSAVRPPDPALAPRSLAVPERRAVWSVGNAPEFVAVSPDGSRAYVTGRAGANVVHVIDTASGRVLASPVAPGPPESVSVAPDGSRVFVTVYDARAKTFGVAVLNASDVSFGGGFVAIPQNPATDHITTYERPFGSAVSPDGTRLYVPNHDDNDVTVIDTRALEITQRVAVAAEPHWICFTPTGRIAYVANHQSGLVTVIDFKTAAKVDEIATGPGSAPHSIAVSPDGRRTHVTNYENRTVTVIETATNLTLATIPVGSYPQSVAFAPDGRHSYIVNNGTNDLSVIDTETNQVTATMTLGISPWTVAVSPDGRSAYVTNKESNSVEVLTIAR